MKKLFLVRPFSTFQLNNPTMKAFNDSIAHSILVEMLTLSGATLVVYTNELSCTHTLTRMRKYGMKQESVEIVVPIPLINWTADFQNVYERMISLGERCDNLVLLAHDDLIAKVLPSVIDHFSNGRIHHDLVGTSISAVFNTGRNIDASVSGCVMRFRFQGA